MKVAQAVEEAVALAKENRKSEKKFLKQHAREIERVAEGLEMISEWVVRIAFDNAASLDISVSGDHHVFKGMWAALRKLGYQASSKPTAKKFSSWQGWFYHEHQTGDARLPIWITFSSTKCTRKKIGVKMVEQPIYEMVCE